MPKPLSWRRNPTSMTFDAILLMAAISVALLLTTFGHTQQGNSPQPSFERIDAHFHAASTDPVFFDMLRRLNIRVLNLCADDKHERGFKDIDLQHVIAREMFRQSGGRVMWTAALDPELIGPKGWERPDFAEVINKQLDQAFKDGAVGVKITKSIGMEYTFKNGKYLMPDDPVFDPIFEHIAAQGKTLIGHIADPSRSWRPVDSSDPDYRYLNNPDTGFWYMYKHPERPTKEAILAARDRMIEKHPNLRIVGAHFGSMEEDVDDIAKRLDRFPNFAVETGGWQQEFLTKQPREKVRAFLIKYQDRVFYGTDELVAPWRRFTAEETAKMIESEYALDWKYFATSETVEILGRKVQGLALPEPVLRKFYHENAIKWFPGMNASQ